LSLSVMSTSKAQFTNSKLQEKREMTYQILLGNNLDILPTLPDNSVDSIVTDPPYELGFMGKKWDSSGIAYSVELWQQCLRVLKPGGHLLSFGGTRTWHRVAVGIEDAGFEIRDSMAWLYGSGFPKSLDVSKAIDKLDAADERLKRNFRFTAWMQSTGITAKQIDQITETMMGSHYTTHPTQPTIATAELFDKLRPYLPGVPEEIERLVAERTVESENYKKREVIGQKTGTKSVDGGGHGIVPGGITEAVDLDITAPATPEAQQWQGWGTALKPAFEPIVVARKPIEGTVAHNVLKWGTGGLNIDGSRIAGEIQSVPQPNTKGGVFSGEQGRNGIMSNNTQGRWPANIILDPYTAELLDEQSGTSTSKPFQGNGKKHLSNAKSGGAMSFAGPLHSDSGGASRFFYVAKASKRDRNEGLDELLETTAADMVDREPDSAGMNSPRAGAGRTSGAKNFHPTVKPTTLMEYLIKLVTPPGGVVLDPFTGSGSTGKAAILQGFDFIGIEMTEEYLPIIEGRLRHAEQLVAEAKEQEKLKENEVLF
jgi:DNA modification methylase